MELSELPLRQADLRISYLDNVKFRLMPKLCQELVALSWFSADYTCGQLVSHEVV